MSQPRTPSYSGAARNHWEFKVGLWNAVSFTIMSPSLDSQFEDEDSDKPKKKADSTAMRILTNWIAMHDGVDDKLGAIVDRGFFVVEIPDHQN